MLKLKLPLLCFFLWHTANSQSTSPFIGASAYGMGNASICVSDEWATFNNIAGLSDIKQSISAVTAIARNNLKGANTVAALFTLPVRYGTVGIGATRFGDNLYSESLACLGFSHKINITSIGLRISYNQFNAEGFGTKGVVSASAGVITQITTKLSIGALVFNINQPSMSSSEGLRLSSVFIAGLGFKASESLFLTSEADKKINEPLIIKAGVEYRFMSKFFIRTGFSSNPSAGYGGVGIKTSRLSINYAYRYDFNLASSHQASLSFYLKNKKT